MKVLMVTVHFVPAWIEGGVTLSSWNLARGLALAGAAVRVVTTDAYLDRADAVPPLREEEGLEIRTLPVVRRLGHAAHRYGLTPGLGRAVRESLAGCDLCLVQGTWAAPAAVASRICRRRGVPYVLCAQGTLERISMSEKPWRKRVYAGLIASRMIREAAAVYCASDSEVAASRARLGATPAIALPHGFDPAPRRGGDPQGLRRRIGAPAGATVLGLAARIHPRKGFGVILPALARSPETVHLVAFGPDLEGHLATVEAQAERLGLRRRFHYLGYVEGTALRELYASLDLLVLPSFGESFGNVVIESLQQGTEVMVSDRVALAGYLRQAALGRVVSGVEPAAWSKAIARWLDDRRPFDGDRAAARVAWDYDLERCGRRLFEALRPLTEASVGPVGVSVDPTRPPRS